MLCYTCIVLFYSKQYECGEKNNHGYRRSSVFPHILVRVVTFPFIIQLQPIFLDVNGFSYCVVICTIMCVLPKN
jgi:hypothetical protein